MCWGKSVAADDLCKNYLKAMKSLMFANIYCSCLRKKETFMKSNAKNSPPAKDRSALKKCNGVNTTITRRRSDDYAAKKLNFPHHRTFTKVIIFL